MWGAALGLSVAASIAAGWDSPPTDYEAFLLFVAATAATAAGVATAPFQKRCLSAERCVSSPGIRDTLI